MLQLFQSNQVAGRGQLYSCYVNAFSILSYGNGTIGGPLLWNGSTASGGRGVTAYLMCVALGVTTASTVAGAVGIATGVNASAPTGTSAVTLAGNLVAGGPTYQSSVYYTGAVAAPTNYNVLGAINTGALTVDTVNSLVFDIGGAIVVPPGTYAAVTTNAAITCVTPVSLYWAEVPN